MRAVVFETSFSAGRDRLCLRLIQEVGGVKVERELIEADGHTQTQVLCFSVLDELKNFLEADPYYNDHQSKFIQINAKALAHIRANDKP